MKMIALFAILFLSCNYSDDPPYLNDSNNWSDQVLAKNSTDAFVHFELLNGRGEKKIGKEPYVYVLPATYQTDNSGYIITENIQHSADICNGSSDTDRVHYPYIRYEPFNVNQPRYNTWVYVSARNLWSDTVQIKAWMNSIATSNFDSVMVDPTENVACLYKLKWRSKDINP